jgi:hypothetical protein
MPQNISFLHKVLYPCYIIRKTSYIRCHQRPKRLDSNNDTILTISQANYGYQTYHINLTYCVDWDGNRQFVDEMAVDKMTSFNIAIIE